MAISIHLDKETLSALDQAVQNTDKSRSGIVKEAVQVWLARRQECDWRRFVQTWGGIWPEFEGFEVLRDDLLPPDDDPMGLSD